jgi:hypothetical protein
LTDIIEGINVSNTGVEDIDFRWRGKKQIGPDDRQQEN